MANPRLELSVYDPNEEVEMMVSTLMYTVMAVSALIGSAIAVEDLKKAFPRPAVDVPRQPVT